MVGGTSYISPLHVQTASEFRLREATILHHVSPLSRLLCRPGATSDRGPQKHGEESKKENEQKGKSKKKGKGKKGKKGKGRGKKSHQEASEKDKNALKDFLDHFKGKRRLMVRRP